MKKFERVPFGKNVRKILNANGISVAWLANQIECDPSNLCKKLNKNRLSHEELYLISVALKINLFSPYNQKLENEW